MFSSSDGPVIVQQFLAMDQPDPLPVEMPESVLIPTEPVANTRPEPRSPMTGLSETQNFSEQTTSGAALVNKVGHEDSEVNSGLDPETTLTEPRTETGPEPKSVKTGRSATQMPTELTTPAAAVATMCGHQASDVDQESLLIPTESSVKTRPEPRSTETESSQTKNPSEPPTSEAVEDNRRDQRVEEVRCCSGNEEMPDLVSAMLTVEPLAETGRDPCSAGPSMTQKSSESPTLVPAELTEGNHPVQDSQVESSLEPETTDRGTIGSGFEEFTSVEVRKSKHAQKMSMSRASKVKPKVIFKMYNLSIKRGQTMLCLETDQSERVFDLQVLDPKSN